MIDLGLSLKLLLIGRGKPTLFLGTPFSTYPIPLELDLNTGLGLSRPSMDGLGAPLLLSSLTMPPPYSPIWPIPNPGDGRPPSALVDVDADVQLGAMNDFLSF